MIYKRQILLYLLEFMRITGLRSQEAKALRKEDFKKEVVTFRDEVSGEMITTKCIIVLINKSVGSTYTEELTIKEPKTMNAVRGVPVLREDDRNFINEILRFTRNDYVFSDYYGNLISSKDVADYIGVIFRFQSFLMNYFIFIVLTKNADLFIHNHCFPLIFSKKTHVKKTGYPPAYPHF